MKVTTAFPAGERELAALAPTVGKVYLVGAGPGDPELLTLKAYRLMQEVDVLVYDRLVSPEILALVPADVRRVFVGKSVGHHCVPQSEINQLIVDLANAGRQVLRLKGGDPYVFGRGGEEAEVLVEAQIPFEVVPGITSAAGAASYAGIPLTHRDYAQSVTFATGHLKGDKVDLDWRALARENSTLVIYMGIGSLAIIAEKLVQHGRASETPVAVVRNATRADQQVVVGTLENIAAEIAVRGLEAPASIIIGEVVALQATLGEMASMPKLLERSGLRAVSA
jgi:uroporphyrin-III C-methyltransferase/precorrin-2 dehydrogenase/sirohydrochlorin ferrochelatase